MTTALQAAGAGRRRAPAAAQLALALLLLLLAAGVIAPAAGAASAGEPVAHAVLFYSPTCSHCRELVSSGLPPIMRQYGDRLQLLAVDASTEPGTSLFRRTVERYDVPQTQRGVPAVVIGDRYLAGNINVAEELPIVLEQQFQKGGVGWPDIPGLAQVADAPGAVITSSPDRLLYATEGPGGILDRLARDRWGNTVALILLAGMVAAAGLVIVRLGGRRQTLAGPPAGDKPGRRPLIAVLIVAGLSVAAYLSYATTTGSTVLCGPEGWCDAVQQSSFARILGVPVAYIGLAGYALIGAAFAISILAGTRMAHRAMTAMLGLTLGGTLFSIYLTVLEPFVIGATCRWCLASAGFMVLLLLLSAERLGLVWRASPAGVAAPGVQDGTDTGRRGSPRAGTHAG